MNIKNALMASGVMFPDIVFEARGEEIVSEIIYDCEIEGITAYIHQIFDYWKQRRNVESHKLSPASIERIVDFLRGDFSFIPTSEIRLKEVDERLIRLTREQSMLMNALAYNDRLLIGKCWYR